VAVFNHVWNSLAGALTELDTDDPAVHAAVARLRRECVDAKEALSADTDVSIPVVLPNLQTEVRLTRNEFESMIRPALGETVVALHRAITGAGVTPDQVSAVLLVGGSSRIPMVSQLLAGELGRPIAVDANPKDAICMGAAIAAAQAVGAATPESVTAVTHAPAAAAAAAGAAATQAQPEAAPAATAAPGTTATPGTPFTPPPAKKGSKGPLVAAVLGLVALVAVAGIFLLGGGDDPEDAGDTTTTEEPDELVETTTTEADAETTTTDPDAYPPQVEATFVNECVTTESAEQPELSAAEVQGLCQCSFDAISAGMTFTEFRELEEQLDNGEITAEDVQAVLTPLIAPCG
jgi:cell division ATPase FtsA